MGWPVKRKIELSEKQKEVLSEIAKSYKSSHSHRLRAEVVLLCSQGVSQRNIASRLNIARSVVKKWKTRWYEQKNILAANDEHLSGVAYRRAILEILSDNPRPGCPGKFTPEQICQIINVACETPEENGLPLSHWTLSELAAELARRGIVESISTSQLAVFLKSDGDKATQIQRMDPYADKR